MIQTDSHNFREIFGWSSNGEAIEGIRIPKIQRDYAQGRTEGNVPKIRERFLRVLYEALVDDKKQVLDFVYGTTEDHQLIPLDGQQRLTTLFLLHYYIAKHEQIASTKYGFLYHFSYETRISSRDFCKSLIDFTPDFSGDIISGQIKDQAWFLMEWESDPTVCAMLVMLDSIHKLFRSTSGLWEKITNDAITFYFLPINEMGLTDELYIKMNSRGKELTLFEHWKAELELQLKAVDESLSKRIAAEIDQTWTDMLWPYRNSNTGDQSADNIIDDEFLRYMHFVSDIISFRNGNAEIDDEFDIIDKQFGPNCPNAKENALLMEQLFNIWEQNTLGCSISEFFGKYLSTEHESGKVISDKVIDLFQDCCRNSGLKENNRRRFPYSRFLLLYAFVLFLLHRDILSDEDFRRRLRILNNLIINSSDFLRADYISGLLKETDEIILQGKVDVKLEGKDHFSNTQLKEEHDKLEWTALHPENAEVLFSLEDHPLLNGSIGVIGLENVMTLNDRFVNFFRKDSNDKQVCSLDNIYKAMLSIGDFGQRENSWRYQLGSSTLISCWSDLFAPTHENERQRTQGVLVELLKKTDNFSNDSLDAIANEMVSKATKFDWRYYFVKYDAIRIKSKYGRFYWRNKSSYSAILMTTQRSLNGYNYDAFLYAIYHLAGEEVAGLQLGNYAYSEYRDNGGAKLFIPSKNLYLTMQEQSYKVYASTDTDTPKLIEELLIPQEENIDTVDRIALGLGLVKKYNS